MIEFMIGAASFFCGFALMFAIHRVIFDYYDDEAKQEIYNLKCEKKALEGDIFHLRQLNTELNTRLSHKDQDQDPSIVVEHMIHHTFATPDDVTNIQFWED